MGSTIVGATKIAHARPALENRTSGPCRKFSHNLSCLLRRVVTTQPELSGSFSLKENIKKCSQNTKLMEIVPYWNGSQTRVAYVCLKYKFYWPFRPIIYTGNCTVAINRRSSEQKQHCNDNLTHISYEWESCQFCGDVTRIRVDPQEIERTKNSLAAP